MKQFKARETKAQAWHCNSDLVTWRLSSQLVCLGEFDASRTGPVNSSTDFNGNIYQVKASGLKYQVPCLNQHFSSSR